jgi:hypothetical protein
MPHDVPSHVAPPLTGTAHALHDDGPQLLTDVFNTQAVPQRWAPALHLNPHCVPSQVAAAFAGAAQAVHDVVPQLLTLVLV